MFTGLRTGKYGQKYEVVVLQPWSGISIGLYFVAYASQLSLAFLRPNSLSGFLYHPILIPPPYK